MGLLVAAATLLMPTTALCAEGILFVDQLATGSNDGSSWASAYTDLQTALAAARVANVGITEVRVAGGTYTPAPPAGDRAVSFEMIDGVVIKGGYAGVADLDPNHRNTVVYQTILSGDLNADDATIGTSDNSFHVVTAAAGLSPTAELNGFTIMAGHATGPGVGRLGGGIQVTAGAPTIIGCILVDNSAQLGGGLYNGGGTPRIVNCLFYDNRVTNSGGGLYTLDATATVSNCTFANNIATFIGGGMVNAGTNANTLVTNCIFWNNSDLAGQNRQSQIQITAGSPAINNSCIQNLGSSTLGGVGNIGGDPLFADPANGDYRLPAGSSCVDLGSDVPPGGLPAIDLDGSARIVGAAVDIGAYELSGNCNLNGNADSVDLTTGQSFDCDENGVLDECQIGVGSTASGGPFFCSSNCDPDCDNNGVPDACEPDCNSNGSPDGCDIAGGVSEDCNGDGIPDECAADCNQNQIPDPCDILSGTSRDCDANGVPDECQIAVVSTAPGGPFFCASNCDPDCNDTGLPDACELFLDCNVNRIPDSCDIADLTSVDCNGNFRPDECEISRGSVAPGGPFFCDLGCDPDCNDNGQPDSCDSDCNANGIADECDLSSGTSGDCDGNSVPDDCQTDTDGDGVIDTCDQCPGTGANVPVRTDGCAQIGACCFAAACVDNSDAADCLGFNGSFLGDLLTCNGDPDNDGAVGCDDGCPNDPGKTAPGMCGCGVADSINPSAAGDCNGNGTPDVCDINSGSSGDCNANIFPDDCDILFQISSDCNSDGVPDECQIDKNGGSPGGPFFCNTGCIPDCNLNGMPDDCDLLSGSEDCDADGVPDECQPDSDGDGLIDPCDPCNGNNALLGRSCDSPSDSDPCETGVYDCVTGTVACTDGPEVDDEDADGIVDCHDRCPQTPPGVEVDALGCPLTGACCSTTSTACFPNTPGPTCGAIGGSYQGNGSACGEGCRFPGSGDCNADGDVDIDDFGLFVDCLNSVGGGPISSQCLCADRNGDGNINLIDVGMMQSDVQECVNQCPVCPRGIGVAEGDCCDPAGNGSVGCNSAACCEAVCLISPLCCRSGTFFGWTPICANIARTTAAAECQCPELPVACCLTNGNCQDLTPTNCQNLGGFPQADGSVCLGDGNNDGRDDACEIQCPIGATGDCCQVGGNGSVGCDNSVCCDAVCAADLSCCLGNWGAGCAALAAALPTECACPEVACCLADGTCQNVPESICLAPPLGGEPQGSGSVCAGDADGNGQDDLCQVCGGSAAGDCCVAGGNGSPGCNDLTCCDTVCNADPFCCDFFWSDSCSGLAASLCSGLCQP